MNIQIINIEKLKPEDEEYQKIKKSLVEFRYVAPVIVNADMTVIGGHQRLKVLKELDPKYCDVIVKRWENLTGEKAILEK